MKIAVSYNIKNESIHSKFDNTKHFKLYDIENNSVICSEIVGTMNCEQDQLVHLLLMFETDALICSELSDISRELLDDEGISIFSGCLGNADELVEMLLAGVLIPR